MAKRKTPYTKEERFVALDMLAACHNDLDRAAKLAKVDVKALIHWAGGGDEIGSTGDITPPLQLDGRPYPSVELMDPFPNLFVPAPEVTDWIRKTFVATDGALHNPDHGHLAGANVGVLWTNIPGRLRGRTAECPRGGSSWVAQRGQFQLWEWFGCIPDFLITLDAPGAAALDDPSFCALVEHECYHCAQAVDEFGVPRETPDGDPIWRMRPHDVEQFTRVGERYGARAAGLEEMLAALLRGPTVAEAKIEIACGTCR